jgi:RNA polymerase sigma-70 factor (ECF subfamily)
MKWLRRTPPTDGSPSDEEAMRRVRVFGDPQAFAQLVARWETPVRRLCVRMTGDEHRGEDLAQEAFARVFANRSVYEDGRRFSTWLWRIALNLCYEWSRRAAVRGEQSLEPTDVEERGAAPGPHERAIASERAAMVRAALARLPEAHRAVVVLRQYEGLKFREVADVLNVPEGTVKWRMTEAMDQLARELRSVMAGDEGDDSPAATKMTPTTMKVSVSL